MSSASVLSSSNVAQPAVADESTPLDIAAALTFVFGTQQLRIDRLTGGFVNWVGRVTFNQGDEQSCQQYGSSSVIVKYATPYIYSAGPDAPFSVLRQTIEARSLAVFTPQHLRPIEVPLDLSYTVSKETCSHVPRLLAHEADRHILVQEDLGPVPSLGTWLSSPGTSIQAAESLGAAIGKFLAAVHTGSRKPSFELRSLFANENAVEVVVREAIDPLRSAFDCAGLPGTELCDFLERQWRGDIEEDLECLCHGDLWHASILVTGTQETKQQAAFIDWEFAGIKTVGSDVAQCVAFLKMFSRNMKTALATPVVALAMKVLATYRDTIGPELSHNPKLQSLLRSSFGLNLGNAAVWHPWCECKKEEGQHCEHVLEGLKEAAVWIEEAMRIESEDGEGSLADWFDIAFD